MTLTTASGATCNCKVIVPDTAISISLSSSKMYLGIEQSSQLIANTNPVQTSNTITWSSSNDTIASVDQDGNVTGVSAGTATIYAKTDNGLSASCAVTVNSNARAIAFEQTEMTLYVGESEDMVVFTEPESYSGTIVFISDGDKTSDGN